MDLGIWTRYENKVSKVQVSEYMQMSISLSAASGDYGVLELRVQISFCVSQALLLNSARVGV